MKKWAELVFIPYPGISHLESTVKIAKLIVDRDDRLFITVLVMKQTSLTDLNAQTNDVIVSAASERIKFVELSPYDHSHPGKFKSVLLKTQKPNVKNVTTEIVRSGSSRPDSPRLAEFVIDMFCTTMIDVANEFGVPTYVFYTSGAGFLGLMFHLQELHDEHRVDPTELQNDPDAELVVPCFVERVPTSALPYAAVAEGWASLLIHNTRRMREAEGIIVNSFLELESHAVISLSNGKFPSLYLVGPILNSTDGGGQILLGDQFSDFITWLDDQPPLSEVFLCFGSMGYFREDQVKEIACALAQRFLDRTAGRGKAIGWTPQVDVLAHRAISWFVSHCGWNSVLGSLWFGVPTATWPVYAEQYLNAFQLVKELGIAEEIKLDFKSGFYIESERTVLGAQEIEGGTRRLMEDGNEIRKRVKEMSEKSRKAVMGVGSSYSSLDRLICDVVENLP
ncbi:UDP-glucuronosyl/UDP-glucosyltransferase [Parasponia andersonii]|uniref:UDP-glucuronosyl/UDP-glucosyltransferase n=1 Tax=Parasponia andersonii TaxID=3476 RepID=A0A2P5AQL2_PARAD|nr:UDP-glucuronosyl/UDP-glucosyltransferase [Parasponia andersonii]